MKLTSIFWAIEFLHFLFYSVHFIFYTNKIIESYSLHPKIEHNIKAHEMIRITAIFCIIFTLLCFLNIFHKKLNVFSCFIYFLLYSTFVINDAYDYIVTGFCQNKLRYYIMIVHGVMGVLHLIIFFIIK